MTVVKNIDADVTAALDRWAAAIGTPEHQAASEALDELLVDLCASRQTRDRSELLTYLMDTASGAGLVIRHVAPNPDSWMHKESELHVIPVNHGETVWDAVERDYREHATDDSKRRRMPQKRDAGDAPRVVTRIADAFWREWDTQDRPAEITFAVRDFLVAFGIWLDRREARAKLNAFAKQPKRSEK